jgi:FMN phosphatase YigB (HAD superfamily)
MRIVSDRKGVFQSDNIKAPGIHPYMKSIVISEWAGVQKPDSAIFHLALQEIRVKASECWFVATTPESISTQPKKLDYKRFGKNTSCRVLLSMQISAHIGHNGYCFNRHKFKQLHKKESLNI